MRWPWWLWYVLILAWFAMLAHLAMAEHTPESSWMRGHVGRDGHSCCGMEDCTQTTVAYLAEQGNDVLVMVGDTVLTLPAAWAHPSKDGLGYWCYVATNLPRYTDPLGHTRTVPPEPPTRDNSRCVFYAGIN